VLDFLRIRGLALLDDVALELGPGMNVLTGETGAGKSIIVDALGLVRGARGRSELVREGEKSARVEAQFSLDPGAKSRVLPVLERQGLPLEEDALVVGRSVGGNGRGRSQLQGQLTTRAVLEEVGGGLIDICSQHEHHSLTHVSAHLELLDAYAGLADKVTEYSETYRRWQEACVELRQIREQGGERVRRADYLCFQIEELESVEEDFPVADALRERLLLLRDAHRWASFANEAHHLLYEADDALASRLAGLAERARRGPESSATLGEIGEQLEAAQMACEEAAQAASRLAGELDIEPAELELVEERVHELDRLERKHGCTVEELGEHLTQMRAELEQLEGVDSKLAEVEALEEELGRRCVAGAKALHKKRKAAARRLSKQIEQELEALHIPSARLDVSVTTLAGGELAPRGSDLVEFLFSANPGEPLAPLSRVASGGELSRVLLAVKGVLATGDRVVTYVFDEVDAGVGGAVAESIGRRLAATARDRQVLCITHLPQIAAFANAHFRVEKIGVDGRTVTRVVELSKEERVEELARMLAGSAVTKSARTHARELIRSAEAIRGAATPAKAKGRSRSSRRPSA
jgi:DNA repair protein RecN (Recombination protein N)